MNYQVKDITLSKYITIDRPMLYKRNSTLLSLILSESPSVSQ
jgi:hypothetical protein